MDIRVTQDALAPTAEIRYRSSSHENNSMLKLQRLGTTERERETNDSVILIFRYLNTRSDCFSLVVIKHEAISCLARRLPDVRRRPWLGSRGSQYHRAPRSESIGGRGTGLDPIAGTLALEGQSERSGIVGR